MEQYLNVASNIIEEGTVQENRTGVDTLSVFGRGVRYDLQDGFPIPTTKKGFFKGAKVELAWMLRGLTNVQYLNDNGVKFWDQWAIKGPHKVLKPLSEIKTKALLTPADIDIDMLYMQGDIEGLEAGLDFPVADEVDDRYALLPPTYEYVLQAVVETHMLTRSAAEKAMFDVACRYNPTIRPVDLNEEIIAKANAEEMKLPDVVRQKTCEIGDLGPVYGQMIREFPNPDGTTTDQLAVIVNQIKNNPTSRRHLVDLWCPHYLPDEAYSPQENVARGKQALAPCHMLWTFKTLKATEEQKRKYVIENYKAFRLANLGVLVEIEQASKGGQVTKEEEIDELVKVAPEYRLNLHSHLRSNDWPAGNPVNAMFYALLTELVASDVDMIPGELWLTGTDVHIYVDQVDGIKEQLKREPYSLPKLKWNVRRNNVWDFEPTDVELVNYVHHENIKFAVAK